MKKAVLIILVIFSQNTRAQLPDAREIMSRSRELSLTGSMSAEISLNIMERNGSVRQRTISMISKTYGNTEKRLIKFLSPPDIKGTAMLIIDNKDATDEMWIYLPALKRTRRISSSEKGKSFMSSEFTNSDLTTPPQDDFVNRHLEDSGTDNIWIIESRPGSDELANEYGYLRKVSYVDGESYIAKKIYFYDQGNKLFKKVEIKNVSILKNGKYLVQEMVADNLANGRKSEIAFKNVLDEVNVDDSIFSLRNLEKL